MTDKLKPCPFCGGDAEYSTITDEKWGNVNHFVTCSNHCIEGLYTRGDTKEEAIEQWNTRPNPWHTGTPTEDGDYFVEYHWGLDNKIMHDMASRILYGATTFENGNWKIDYPYVVVAWQKIEPCYPTQEMVKGE